MNGERGQSLIETLVALSVMVVGIAGAVSLGIISIRAGQTSQLDVVAENLAQEGIEAARAVRDYNWTLNQDWDTNLTPGHYRVIVGSEDDPAEGQVRLERVNESTLLENLIFHLCRTKTGQYFHPGLFELTDQCATLSHPTWEETAFNRWVTVTPYIGNSDKLLIKGEVLRSGGVGTVTYTAAEDLYNWK